jgi:alpha-1,6-mannosyltransferase
MIETLAKPRQHAQLQRIAVARPWQTNAALVVLGIAMIAFTRQLVSEYDGYTIGYSGVSSAQVALYLAAIGVVFAGARDRFTFWILVGFAIACRCVTLNADPALSSDVYRYVWDGIVQHAHINPYRYFPSEEPLGFLRTASGNSIYPEINRKTYAHTIYPPAAQMLFYLTTWISPTLTFMKTVIVLFEGLLLWATIQLLKPLSIPREQAVLYMWCPLAIWEFSGSGHLDSVAMAWIALALLFRYRNRPVLTGLFLGLAVMTKLYPLVLLPALYQRGRRDGWKMPATLAAVCVVGYGVYLSAGMLVFGFLGGYVQEEGMANGTRYFLLELVQHIRGLADVPNAAYVIFCGLVMAGLAWWSWNTASRPALANASTLGARAPFLLPAFALAGGMMLLFSPHYPWYIAWLIPFLVLLPNVTMLTYICGLFYLCTTAMAVGYGPKQYLLNKYLYGWVALAAIMQLALRRWPIQRYIFPPRPL